MAHPDKLAAEIEAAEKKIYGNPDGNFQPRAANPAPAPEGTSDLEDDPTETPTDDEGLADHEDDDPEVTPDDDGDDDSDGVAKARSTSTNWEERFKAYKATADVTIHGLRRTSVAQQEEIQSLQGQLSELAAKFGEITSEKNKDISEMFTDEERELIGPETLKAMQKYNDAMLEATVAPIKSELQKEREARKREEQRRLADEKTDLNSQFLKKLGKVVPNYDVIDKDPKFLAWMKLPDAVSGFPRETLFINAHRNGDVVRVAEFFKEWKRITTPKDKLANKLTPTGVGTSNPTPQNRQKPAGLTIQQIDKFYDDVAKGKYRNNSKAQQEMERRIDAHLKKTSMGRKPLKPTIR